MHMDCLFSFYARPYVFTFYVTVCECHIALKATWLDLTWISATTLNFWQSHHEYTSSTISVPSKTEQWHSIFELFAKNVFFSKTGKYRNALFRRWNVFTYSTCVKWAIGSFRFWFDVNDPLLRRYLRKTISTFSSSVTLTFDLKSSPIVTRVQCRRPISITFEVSTALQFQIHRRHGTDGRTDRRAGAILNARAPHNNNECTV